ncbi:snRNA-activating protein complex subunit isoform X1 [Tanacetum coccineum]
MLIIKMKEDILIARGGPLYLTATIGPLTDVSKFQAFVANQLKVVHEFQRPCADLTSEPCSEFHGQNHHEFSVNDIKLLSDKEFFDMALQAFTEHDVEKENRCYTIKQDQEKFKSAARLHSFSGDLGSDATANLPEKKESALSLEYTNLSTQVKSNLGEHKQLGDSETLLCVEVYSVRQETWVKTQEIMVLGRQFLTELRDNIKCLTDEIMNLAGKHDPSGYFLIEDTFYNDLREDNATDFSEPILTWVKGKDAIKKWNQIIRKHKKSKVSIGSGSDPKVPELGARSMQTTRFCELRFRLGADYFYCHQGDCKHIMVIRDMRAIHQEDVHNETAYPLNLFQRKFHYQKCMCCNIFKATKVTRGDKLAQEDPCYFCDDCYNKLHYVNEQLELVYDDFKVYKCIQH